MHFMLPPGPAMCDSTLQHPTVGVKLCSGAWKRGQDSHVGMFSLSKNTKFYILNCVANRNPVYFQNWDIPQKTPKNYNPENAKIVRN